MKPPHKASVLPYLRCAASTAAFVILPFSARAQTVDSWDSNDVMTNIFEFAP